MHFHLGAYHDYRTAGIVDTFTQQVLTETALLAFQHIGQGFQRTVSGSHNRTAAATVVNEGVYRFLQHAFFITHNNIRSMQLQQPFQTVVAVDYPAVQVVQVAGSETAAVQLNHGTQVRGNNRYHIQNHPGRFVARFLESFRYFQTANNTDLLLAVSVLHFFPQLFNEGRNINFFQQFFNCRSTHLGAELIPVFVTGTHVFCF